MQGVFAVCVNNARKAKLDKEINQATAHLIDLKPFVLFESLGLILGYFHKPHARHQTRNSTHKRRQEKNLEINSAIFA